MNLNQFSLSTRLQFGVTNYYQELFSSFERQWRRWTLGWNSPRRIVFWVLARRIRIILCATMHFVLYL